MQKISNLHKLEKEQATLNILYTHAKNKEDKEAIKNKQKLLLKKYIDLIKNYN